MALDTLLKKLENQAVVTPETPCNPTGVTARPAPLKGCTPVTHVTPRFANLTSWRWILHYPDHDAIVTATPEATLSELLRDFPGSISAEPLPIKPSRKATPSEVQELRELMAIVYADDTEAEQFESWTAALQDIDDALLCYRSIVAMRHGQTTH